MSSELYALRKELWVCAGQEAGWAGVETVKNKKEAGLDGNPSLLPKSSNLSTLTWIPWLCQGRIHIRKMPNKHCHSAGRQCEAKRTKIILVKSQETEEMFENTEVYCQTIKYCTSVL